MGCKIPDIDWKAVAILFITGQRSLADLANDYKISYDAIRHRSSRGRWSKLREEHLRRLEGEVVLMPPDPDTGSRRMHFDTNGAPKLTVPKNGAKSDQNYHNEQSRAQEIGGEVVTQASTADFASVPSVPGDKTEAIAATIWAERQMAHRNLVFRVGHEGVKKASRKIKAPTSWKDLEIADRVARKAAGLDKEEGPQVNVLINLGALNGALKAV